MLDYHLHLWPHDEATTWCSLDQVADYCERAQAAGVTELALTEHLHRFTQAADVVGAFWDDAPDDPAVRRQLATYFDFHARSDLDEYVTLCEAAKSAGLPVVTGMEVDYYRGQMDAVAELLDGYPFDVLLGSVHWILGRGVRLWSAHYDSGFCEITNIGPTDALMRIHAFATPHQAHCLSVAGWVERSVELSGGKRPVVVESRCRTRGDSLCQIDISWEQS